MASQLHRNTILSVLQYQGRLPVNLIKIPTVPSREITARENSIPHLQS